MAHVFIYFYLIVYLTLVDGVSCHFIEKYIIIISTV